MLLDFLLSKSIIVLIFLFFIISDTCVLKSLVNFLFVYFFPFSFKQFKASISSFLIDTKLFIFTALKGSSILRWKDFIKILDQFVFLKYHYSQILRHCCQKDCNIFLCKLFLQFHRQVVETLYYFYYIYSHYQSLHCSLICENLFQ